MNKNLLSSMTASMLTVRSDVMELVLDGVASLMQMIVSIFADSSSGMVSGNGITESGHMLDVSVLRGDGSVYGTSSDPSVMYRAFPE